MAADEPTGTNTKTLSADEVANLADRLFSRGTSKLLNDQPSMQADLRTASRVLRTLLHEIDRVAAQCDDTARLLRNLMISVEG